MIYNQFYSNKNVGILKKIISDDLNNNLNIKNININNQLKKCMDYVKSNVSSVPPKNISDLEYLNLMNKKAYNLVLSYYKNNNNYKIVDINIENDNGKIVNESNKIENNLFDNEILKNYKNNNNIIEYPVPSSHDNSNIDKHTEKLKQERELIYPQSKEINFSLDEKDDKNNTVDLYNDLLTSYNQQVSNLNKYEDKQNIINNDINEKLLIIEDNNTNVNKLTPITSLSDSNIQNNKVHFEDSIENFKDFLNQNNNEIQKENVISENKIENNSINFAEANQKKNIIVTEPKYETILKTDYIVIDSRYRNFDLYPNQCNFVVKFSPSDNNFIFNSYKENDTPIIREKKIVIGNNTENDIGETFDNVHSVFLDNVIVPTHSFEYTNNENGDGNINSSELSLTIYKDSYLLLEIPELRSPYKGGNVNFKKTFAILRINHGSSLTSIAFSNNFINLIVPNEIMLYEPSSLGKLDKFSIKLNNKNGRVYNFGIDKLYVHNIQKGELKYLGICGKKQYSTKFEIVRKHDDYAKICKNYYNIENCNVINNNPLVTRDLIYFYHVVPNEDQMIFFEDYVRIDDLKRKESGIEISLSYKLNNKYEDINHLNLFKSFQIANENYNNYYFLLIFKGNKYFLKIKDVNKDYIICEKYKNLPNFQKTKTKIGLSKGNKSGSNNDDLSSMFYSSGYNVISVNTTQDEGNKLGKYIIEIDYPYDNLPNYMKENNFTDNDLFLIQDKKQISYGFTIKYNVKDYSNLNSNLNESGNN